MLARAASGGKDKEAAISAKGYKFLATIRNLKLVMARFMRAIHVFLPL